MQKKRRWRSGILAAMLIVGLVSKVASEEVIQTEMQETEELHVEVSAETETVETELEEETEESSDTEIEMTMTEWETEPEEQIVGEIRESEETERSESNTLTAARSVIAQSAYLEAGKKYAGVEYDSAITVTETSAFTVQVLTTYVQNANFELSDPGNCVMETLVLNGFQMPRGTTITLVASMNGKTPSYWYYHCMEDLPQIELGKFRKMNKVYGTAEEADRETVYEMMKTNSSEPVTENMIFVFDFRHVAETDWKNTSLAGDIMLRYSYEKEKEPVHTKSVQIVRNSERYRMQEESMGKIQKKQMGSHKTSEYALKVEECSEKRKKHLIKQGETVSFSVTALGGSGEEEVKVQVYRYHKDTNLYKKVKMHEILEENPGLQCGNRQGWMPTISSHAQAGTYRLEFAYHDKTEYWDFIVTEMETNP